MHAPARVPPAITAKVHEDLVRVLAIADIREKLRQLGSEGVGNSPDEFARFVRAEAEKYSKLIREAGIRVE
jgi:tripartite-type tricarboxylate transporter receptor subunit TctC